MVPLRLGNCLSSPLDLMLWRSTLELLCRGWREWPYELFNLSITGLYVSKLPSCVQLDLHIVQDLRFKLVASYSPGI